MIEIFRDTATVVRLTNKEIEKAAKHVTKRERINDAELSFVIVGDRMMRRINKNFLSHDYVTDVITFPLEAKKVNAEIYINIDQAKRQARQYSVTIQNELIRLVVHGTLHAIGYDDTNQAEQKKMERVQEQYVSELS
ncbi:MAG: rRNA maturation RNase YbeY [Bacteroidota bacterium]